MTLGIFILDQIIVYFFPLVLGNFSLLATAPESVFLRVCPRKRKPGRSELLERLPCYDVRVSQGLHLHPTPGSFSEATGATAHSWRALPGVSSITDHRGTGLRLWVWWPKASISILRTGSSLLCALTQSHFLEELWAPGTPWGAGYPVCSVQRWYYPWAPTGLR